jgi:hypothetical protein
MIKQLRTSFTSTALAMTPFLLSGCGPDNEGGNKRVAIAIVAVLFLIVSMTTGQVKAVRAASGRAA